MSVSDKSLFPKQLAQYLCRLMRLFGQNIQVTDGRAVFDILGGKVTPAGRLSITQYPANYVSEIPMTDMSLRPDVASPGYTYLYVVY